MKKISLHSSSKWEKVNSKGESEIERTTRYCGCHACQRLSRQELGKMRESRWRSMSIMDLNLGRRKSSDVPSQGGDPPSSGATQMGGAQGNYELIKSTQVRMPKSSIRMLFIGELWRRSKKMDVRRFRSSPPSNFCANGPFMPVSHYRGSGSPQDPLEDHPSGVRACTRGSSEDPQGIPYSVTPALSTS